MDIYSEQTQNIEGQLEQEPLHTFAKQQICSGIA